MRNEILDIELVLDKSAEKQFEDWYKKGFELELYSKSPNWEQSEIKKFYLYFMMLFFWIFFVSKYYLPTKLENQSVIIGGLLGCTYYLGVLFHAKAKQRIRHQDRESGKLIFTPEHVFLNQEKISWEEIKIEEIYFSDFISYSFDVIAIIEEEAKSNYIKFSIGDKFYEYIFQSTSKFQEQYIAFLMWEVVRLHIFDFEYAKRLVKPQNYKEVQILKAYCEKRNAEQQE